MREEADARVTPRELRSHRPVLPARLWAGWCVPSWWV